MTGRPTTQGASATELTDSPVRSGHQFDGLANASNRAPKLVATTAENISVEPSGKAPLPATKRSRASPAPKRTKSTKAKGKQEAPSIESPSSMGLVSLPHLKWSIARGK